MSTQGLNTPQQTTIIETEKIVPQDSNMLKQGTWGSGNTNWQQERLGKGSCDSSNFLKRDQLYHMAQLPQGQQAMTVPPPTLPVTLQGFSQGGFSSPAQSPLLAERTVMLEKPVVKETVIESAPQQQQGQFFQQSMGQTGVIPLKPICIEQEAVTFNPQRITIEQPPLTIQPEPITIPQPPIVIHPEPIVIPQASLKFQPPPVTLPRQALSYQPDVITLNRPSYSVQPFIQYDMRGCAKFGQPDFKQHVHIKLTNDQIMRQQYGGSQWQQQSQYGGFQGQQGQFSGLQSGQVSPSFQEQPVVVETVKTEQVPVMAQQPCSPGKDDNARQKYVKPAKFWSRDRNYDYGLPPSAGDKLKDAIGVSNLGPQRAPNALGSGYQGAALGTGVTGSNLNYLPAQTTTTTVATTRT